MWIHINDEKKNTTKTTNKRKLKIGKVTKMTKVSKVKRRKRHSKNEKTIDAEVHTSSESDNAAVRKEMNKHFDKESDDFDENSTDTDNAGKA